MTQAISVRTGMGAGTHSKQYSDMPAISHWSDGEVASFGNISASPDWTWGSDGTDMVGLGAASAALKLQPNADTTNYLTLSTTSGIVDYAVPRGSFTSAYTTDAAITGSFAFSATITLDQSRTSVAILGLPISTITAGAAYTVDSASTLYIEGAPTAGGSAVITAAYSIYVAAGTSYFGGPVTFTDTTFTLASGTDIVSAGAINFKVSGDNDDYLTLTTASDVVNFTATGASTFKFNQAVNLSAGATFGGAELVVGASNVLHVGASGGTPVHATNSGDVYIHQRLEVNGPVDITNTLDLTGNLTLNGGSLIIQHTSNSLLAFVPISTQVGIGTYTQSRNQIVIGPVATIHTNHDHTDATDSFLYIHSRLAPNTDHSEFVGIGYNGINPTAWAMETDRATFDFTIRAVSAFATATTNKDGANLVFAPGSYETAGTGAYGAFKTVFMNGAGLSLKAIEETVTITATNTTANTSGNLAPANSMIMGVVYYVTQAPGGGATKLDIGRTAGNTDEFIDKDLNAPCASLSDSGGSYQYGDASITGSLINVTATTLTVTLDAAVTGASLIVRIVVIYYDLTVPTS